MARIVFEPSGVAADVPDGTPLRDAAVGAGVEIASTCGGVASCGLCRVRIASGEANLEPLTPGEFALLGNVFFVTRERLACQARARGEVVCEVPDAAEAGRRPRRAARGARR